MTFVELKEQVAGMTAITNGDKLEQKINAAAIEVWNSIDLPGCLFEDYFKVGVDNYVTLPYYIYRVRGAKPCHESTNVELNSPVPAFFDQYYEISPWRWRLLHETPLLRNIEEASTLQLKLLVAETHSVLVSLAGPSDIAERSSETVEIPAGETEVLTVNRYEDLELLRKNVKTNSNLEVYDAAGNQVAMIPNNHFDARNQVIQVVDNCANCLTDRCLAVLYKPTLPILSDDLDTFPDPYAYALIQKILEHILLESPERLEQAAIVATKGNGMFDRFSEDSQRGMTRRFNTKRSPFHKMSGYSGL